MSQIEEIKNRLDIVDVIGGYIKLKKTGANYSAPCPFHSEKSPSFFVSPSKQIWHCFGECGIGGDIFKFVMKIEGVEFKEALKILADRAGIKLKKENKEISDKKERIYQILSMASSFFIKQMESLEGKKAKDYLIKRGLREETIKKWKIGYAPLVWRGLSDFLISKGYKREEIESSGLALTNKDKFYDRFRGRIIFPVLDNNSRVRGFGGRAFSEKDSAKYINSPSTIVYDKSQTLYGLNNASLEIRKKDYCILTEGYMDVIMVSQAGFENVVSASGTSFTPFQLKIIKRHTNKLYMAFDMDSAGSSATRRAIEMAQEEDFDVKIIVMEEGSDPADIAGESPSKWKKMVDEAISVHDFYFKKALLHFDKDTIEGKKGISKEILPVIKKIPNKIEQGLWIKTLSRILEIREDLIIEELSKVKNDNYQEEKKEVKKEKKERKEIIEDYLLFLLFKRKDLVNFVREEDLIFFNEETVNVIKEIKNNPEKIRIENDKINAILLKSELEKEEEGIDKEIQRALREIKKDCYKKKLEEITFMIREKEREGKDIEELKEKFNNLLFELNNLK